MARAALQPVHPHPVRRKFTLNFQDVLPNPDAPNVSTWPPEAAAATPLVASPQIGSINFTAATLADSAFPPDTMGTVGPTQFIIALNNRIRSFDKSTGIADGVLNVDTDIFFQSVMTPPLSDNFTSDPRIRYDRLSGRWFITIIDVPGRAGDQPNRVLLAVSDTSTITPATTWTYFFFRHDTVTPSGDSNNFADYPTLGIDANALYIGVNIFSARGRGSFSSTTGFVVRKSSILGSGPIVVTAFRGLVSKVQGILQGLYTPQGVDNYDPAATEGYFIGVDPSFSGRLHLLRIINPGGSPSTPGRVQINVLATGGTLSVPHLGNTGDPAGNLDGLDRRLIAAHVRHGRLWTTANIAVDNTGAPSAGATRDGVRWYELQGIASGQTPTVFQSGTVFQPSASNDASQRHYWMGSVMVSGQGHAAMGFSVAGANERINAGTVGRLASDAPGTMRTPLLYTASTTAYNPAQDIGGAEGRRWGDYSYTSLDPSDDMTMWTLQQFCNATDSYGVQVLKLLAPPPATPITCNPATLGAGTNNVVVTITGDSTNGSGFFDPGAGFSNHLAVAVTGTGTTIADVHFIDPTHLTMTVSLSANATSGARTITVTNPDGQTASSAIGIFSVTGGNTPPSISNLSDQTIPEDSSTGTQGFTIGDSETPAPALVVTASSSNTNLVTPSGISFGGNAANRTVVIIPATNQFGSSTITIIVTDASGGTASNSFQLNVTPVNDAPVLVPGIHTINEGQTLLVTNSASDIDGPALSFSLGGAPAGATIDAATGVFSWNPTEVDGPGTNLIKVIVTDGGSPSLSATQTLTVVVNEINVAPFLQPIADRIIYQGTTLTITNLATDPDIPANQISHSLSNAPVGAVIQPLTGVFTWTPTAAQADTTNEITVIVTDDGTPALSASETFQVIVSSPPYIQSITADASEITIAWSAVPGTAYQLQYKTSLEETTWTDLPGEIVATRDSASRDLFITDSQGFYRVVVVSQ